ncbi:MAG TPA: ATP-binding cassette domain-containing protein [Candidatus Polarisedimenticolia bacterium]|nr:ATP-binding cassette domain-containing protein [Candidatus Polarisedimenticolia bacterium]
MSIIVDHISKRFGQHLALDEVSLEVADGELFVLLGGSGSGKSTALRIIAGLTRPDEGRVLLQGERVDHLPPQKRGVGFVFQNYSLFQHMTVGGNIEFGMRIHKVPGAERIRRREELLNLIGLEGMADALPQRLSGGQQQRVAVARALAYQPAVLLMDEPFGALDARTRSQLRKSLKEIQRKLKVTTILVTHDQEEAFELADRIGILERGHLVEIGPPSSLYRKPKTEMVARFLGDANLLLGEIRSGALHVGESILPLPADAPQVKGSLEVKVLIRPEDLEVRPRGAANDGRGIGLGKIQETLHAGPLLRMRIGIPALRGTPIFSPEPVYGQVEPTLLAHARPESGDNPTLLPGTPVQLSVRSLHVIPHEGVSLLVCIDGSELAGKALEFGAQVASQMHGRIEVLGVAEKPNEETRAREGLASAAQAYSARFPNLKTRFRQGEASGRILEELARGAHDVVVLGCCGRHGPGRTLGSTAERVLALSRVPLLMVPEPRRFLKKMLICMAAGVSGRSDVLFAGRLAGRAGAEATLLHVMEKEQPFLPGTAPDPHTSEYLKQLTTERLARGILTLKLMGVTSEMKIRQGNTGNEILEEAHSGEFDLITLGASHAARARGGERRGLLDVILERARRPVLIVPSGYEA